MSLHHIPDNKEDASGRQKVVMVVVVLMLSAKVPHCQLKLVALLIALLLLPFCVGGLEWSIQLLNLDAMSPLVSCEPLDSLDELISLWSISDDEGEATIRLGSLLSQLDGGVIFCDDGPLSFAQIGSGSGG